MRTAVLAAAMACVVSTGARAAVVFELTGQTYNAEAQLQGATADLTLTLADAAVQQGSFNLTEIASTAINTLTGDVADFQGVSSFFQTVTATTAAFATVRITLTFAGNVASGSIDFQSEGSGINLSGTAGLFSGAFGTDSDHCSGSLCTVVGSLTQVPEPASVTLLAFGLLGLGVRRRNATASVQ